MTLSGVNFTDFTGTTLKSFSATSAYAVAYNILFLDFGALVVIGILIFLFLSGPFVRNKTLQDYADGKPQLAIQ